MLSHRELEYKFRVHGLFEVPESTVLGPINSVLKLPTRRQHSRYFDTPDFRLFRWGVTLRQRTGGTDDGWHIKLPLSGSTEPEREELHFSSQGETQVPERVASVLLGYTRGAELKPAAEVVTERTPYHVVDSDGTILAEIDDDVVSVLNGEQVIEKYREIEVEVFSASRELIQEITTALTNAGALPSTESKLAHALGPKLSTRLEVQEPVHVLPSDPAALAVVNHLRRQTRALVLADVGIRRNLSEGVHDLRVAARRLRSGLQVFKSLIADEQAQFLRQELGWIATELGLLRDSEVMIERLKANAKTLGENDETETALSFIFSALEESIEENRAKGLDALSSARYFALIDELITYTETIEFTEQAWRPAKEVLPDLAHEAWKKLKKDVEELRIEGPTQMWHDARIQAKRARYAIELLVPVFGKDARVLAKSLTRVTELLGEHQDCAVAAQRTRDISSTVRDPEVAFALGVVAGRELGQELVLRRDFLEMWPEVVAIHKRARLR